MKTLPSGIRYGYGNNGERICTGSSMGRRDTQAAQEDTSNPKLRIRRLRWVDGDYDEQGAYWGYCERTHIYWAHGDETQFECFVRATSRKDAKEQVADKFNGPCRFYR